MGTSSTQAREFVWQGRLWPLLPPYLIAVGFLLAVGAVVTLLVGVVGVGDHAATAGDRIFVGLIPAACLGPVFLYAFGMSPRRLKASGDRLVLERWLFGRRKLAKDQILGVRARSATQNSRVRSILVDVRGRRSPVAIADIPSGLQADGGEVLSVLTSLFGVSPVESAPRTTAASQEAVELSQKETSWKPRACPRELLALDIICPLAAIVGAVYWRSIWAYMVGAEGTGAAIVLCAALVVGTFTLLAIFDLITGGSTRELIVGSDGLTLRRRWRDLHIRAEDILGVRHTFFADSGPGPAVSNVLVVRRGRWNLLLRENRFAMWTPGLLAGVMLHRFGEYLPPNTSARPAV
jgi:hypothetical protein